jgi:hypothetical protein
MSNLTPDEWRIVRAVLLSDVVKWALGAENWDLSEADEEKLWALIERLKVLPNE